MELTSSSAICKSDPVKTFINGMANPSLRHSHPNLYSDYPTRDIISEVYNDIDTHCQKVAEATVAPGKQWTDCSDWAYTDRDSICKIKCQSDCGNESNVGKCISDCYDAKCPIVPQNSLLLNRINWEIQHDGNGDETRTLSYDTCKDGFKNVLENCKDYGGELNHGGFWFKLDPNNLRCDQAF